MKKFIQNYVEVIGISTIVIKIWQGLEILFFKEIKPDIVDTIIAIPIVLILFLEYKKYISN